MNAFKKIQIEVIEVHLMSDEILRIGDKFRDIPIERIETTPSWGVYLVNKEGVRFCWINKINIAFLIFKEKEEGK